MSFSMSTGGTVAEVRSAIKNWPATVEASDRQNSQLLEVVEGHQRQVNAGVQQIEKFLDSVPKGYAVNATCGGHADSNGGDSLWLSLGYSRPAAVAEAPAAAKSDPVAKTATS